VARAFITRHLRSLAFGLKILNKPRRCCAFARDIDHCERNTTRSEVGAARERKQAAAWSEVEGSGVCDVRA
jgi:hypothetical protein